MTSFIMFYPCKRSGPSLCVHVKQQEKCGRISGVGNKLKKGPSLQDSENITLRIVCCRVHLYLSSAAPAADLFCSRLSPSESHNHRNHFCL